MTDALLAIATAGRVSEVHYVFIRRVIGELKHGASMDTAWRAVEQAMTPYRAFWPERTPVLEARITDYLKRAK